MDAIIKYLKIKKKEAQKVRNQAARYILLDNDLYKRSFFLLLLKYLHPSEANYAMQEVHEQICENYMGGRFLSYKILW